MCFILQITEWLCLNCHTKRASGISSMQSDKIPSTSSPQNKKTSVSEHPEKKKDLSDKTIQRGQTTADVKQKDEISAAAAEKQVSQQQPTLQHSMEKSPKASKVKPSPAKDNQENSGFFDIGRSRSPSPQPTVSAVTGKVLGFGSSFFSSASNLISSAVQDEPITTPPTSRKDSSVSQSSTRSSTPPQSSHKHSGVIQATIPQENSQKMQTDINKSQISENKDGKKPDVAKHKGKDLLNTGIQEPLKVKGPSHILPKNCPLCKVEIRSDPPNYSTCTDCKKTVCMQCGFNPAPHQTEVRRCMVIFQIVFLSLCPLPSP